jgi:hypothetical protein
MLMPYFEWQLILDSQRIKVNVLAYESVFKVSLCLCENTTRSSVATIQAVKLRLDILRRKLLKRDLAKLWLDHGCFGRLA